MILKIEKLSINAWPALQTSFYDGWVLRFSQGYTKRANSINPIYSSTIDINTKLKICEKIYFAMGLPVVYKLTETSYPSNIDDILEADGYDKVDKTSVLTLILADFNNNKIKGLEIEFEFSQDWIDSFAACSNCNEQLTLDVMAKMLKNISGNKICVKMNVNNEIVACGFGVIEDNYVGIFDIIVKPGKRGKGYGKTIMTGILGEAQNQKVEIAYLQVVVGNSIAENLYSKLGFKEVYQYWYRIKQDKI